MTIDRFQITQGLSMGGSLDSDGISTLDVDFGLIGRYITTYPLHPVTIVDPLHMFLESIWCHTRERLEFDLKFER